ncbi:MAG TPA: FtsX-like permease family protein [Streptosporangiaceae bacterium]|nr:FtsX-like permease family protein [Streptosporangiaceae bacterium]
MLRARSSILWPRMWSVWPLLLSVLLSTLIAASLVAAFAGFSAAALPQAVSAELAGSAHRFVAVSGAINAQQERSDAVAVRASVARAFGTVPYASADATWSDPIGLPARGSKTVPLVQAAAMTGIRAQVKLTEGSWPASPATPGDRPIEAAVPATAAATLHLSVGQELTLRDRVTGTKVSFRVTGVYRPVNQAAAYWSLDLIPPSGVSVQPGFITYGPFLVSGSAFSASGAGGRLAVGGASWLYQLGTTRVAASQLTPLSARINAAGHYLTATQSLGGLAVTTGLPALLATVATKLVVARSLLLVGELELLLLSGAALTLTARTLASQREEEAATFSARGAGRRQLLRLALAESLLVTVVAAAAGAVLGSRLAAVLATTGPLRRAGLVISGIPADDWLTVAAVLVLCTAVMIWPALRPASPSQARARRGRRAAIATAATAGADVGLLVLAVLAGWQLREYSVLGRTSAGLGVDPVLALAPAVALAAGTVLPLRLLPLLARAGDRLAARTRRLGGALTSWELARRATRQSAPMLLVVLAVGTSTLALAQHDSWRQSALDQSAFLAGADVRASTLQPATPRVAGEIAHAPGVTAAMAVATALNPPSGGEVLAVDARQGPAAVLATAGGVSPAAWRQIAPPGPRQLITLPGHPVRIQLTASMAEGQGPAIGPVLVVLTVQDAAGVTYTIAAGDLRADGRPHSLVATLASSRQAIYPLRLLAITASYAIPPQPAQAQVAAQTHRIATFTVSGLATAQALGGPFTARLDAAALLGSWLPSATPPQFADSVAGQAPEVVTPMPAGTVRFHPGFGVELGGFIVVSSVTPVEGQVSFRAPVTSVIPGIATTAFLRANHLNVGSVIGVTAGEDLAPVNVRIVAAVASFPTVTSPGGALIVDQAAAQDVVAAQGLPPVPVTQWWLATRSGAPPPGLPRGTTVTTKAGLAAALLGDPMAVIPQQAIQATALAAALLAVLGFSVSIAGSVRERRSQSALLAALGVTARTQARLLSFEALALTLPAAATGLLLGTVLAHLLVPAVTLTATAAAPAVPVLVRVPLAPAIAIALVVTALPVLAATASAIRRPDPAAQLRASEAV